MRTILLALATLTLAVAPAPAGATHCDPDDGPSIGIIEIHDGRGGVYYLADEEGEWGPLPVHLYEETNGIYSAALGPHDNLQRDTNGSPYIPDDWTPCSSDPWAPDTLLL